jgi:antitoxin (DNA-binding transcriptional repressor) of toxin-antitoxin stability system
MATTVNMSDARSSLSKLAARAAAGEDILIARAGTPVAMLTRVPRTGRKRLLGLFRGKIRIAKDFDAPLAEFSDYQ